MSLERSCVSYWIESRIFNNVEAFGDRRLALARSWRKVYFYSWDDKSLKDGTCHGNADTAFHSLHSDDNPHFHLFFFILSCDHLHAQKYIWP